MGLTLEEEKKLKKNDIKQTEFERLKEFNATDCLSKRVPKTSERVLHQIFLFKKEVLFERKGKI